MVRDVRGRLDARLGRAPILIVSRPAQTQNIGEAGDNGGPAASNG
jgi:hypothetical protein